MNIRRVIIPPVFLVVVCAIAWQLFYTDKRSASGPVEKPLRWLNEETLLSFENGSLFLREQGTPRRNIYTLSPPGNMFSPVNSCIAEDRWWLATIQKTFTGSTTNWTWKGPVSLKVKSGPNGQVSILETTQHERLAQPLPTSCMQDDAYQAATSFLRDKREERSAEYISVDGRRYLFRTLGPPLEELGSFGTLSSAPTGGHLYLHDYPRGLITLAGEKLSVHTFPDDYIKRFGPSKVLSWGYALWDRSLERVLFIQSACEQIEGHEPCTRKALWLTPDLEPLNIIELPGESLVEIKPGYRCFSCGCGCYSHQNIYVEGGNVFAHVWGYPVVNERRGIYRLNQTPSGPEWEKVVSGRPQPPLAFSPSARKVAYFEISRFGDRFVVSEIPDKSH